MEDIKDLLKCPKYITTQRADYKKPENFLPRNVQKNKQSDESLISGHWINNLTVRDLEQITKTWPKSMERRETYVEYLERLKLLCHADRYKKHFENPDVVVHHIARMLKDLKRTEYSSKYSPQEYNSLKKQKQAEPTVVGHIIKGDHRTTYRISYNPITAMDEYKREMKRQSDRGKLKFEKERLAFFKRYNPSTYFDELCFPALVVAKDGVMPTGPIDRYTNRRN